MKKVILFSILALVCTAVMTSCGDDDKNVALTGITVAPKTITQPVGGVQQVNVTAVPADATDVVYTWTSQNPNVATISETGLVTIVGVGSTTVTVSSGSVTETITVTGTINGLTVKDEKGESSGSYPYNGQPITFKLTASVVPEAADITPVWTSSASTVTVEGDGLSATVTINGEGTATITAAVGNITGTYTISTSSVFESAVGYWTFQDPNNLGKATRGTDLIVYKDNLNIVPGPSPTKVAVEAIKPPIGAEDESMSTLEWKDHPFSQPTRTYTMLFDVQPFWGLDWHGATLMWNGRSTSVHGFQVLSRIEGSVNGYAWGTPWKLDEGKADEKPWYRLVVKIWPAKEGEIGPSGTPLPLGAMHREVWSNGKKTEDGDIPREDASIDGDFFWGFVEFSPEYSIWFISNSHTGTTMEGGKFGLTVPISTVAVWNRLLEDEEIASLGGVSK